MRPARVRIDPNALGAFESAAANAWPDEAVALLGGRTAGGTTTVDRCVPIPGAGRRDGFVVDPPAFLAAEAELRRAGASFVGFAHSHPGGAAMLSAQDRAELWPRCVQIVAGSLARGTWTAAAFWLDEGAVTSLPVEIEPPRSAP